MRVNMDRYMDKSTAAERASRRERAKQLTSGYRSPGCLNAAEHELLVAVHAAGYEIATGRVYNVRTGTRWQHPRVVTSRRIS
jgi:hypothetical protein